MRPYNQSKRPYSTVERLHLNKNWLLKVLKAKEATAFLMSDEYRCSKDNPLPMYELVLHANWHIFWTPKIFSNLHSAESEQLDWRKTGRLKANSCSNAIFRQSISHVLTGCMSSQGFPQKNPEKRNKPKEFVIPSHSAAHRAT